jgi:hypothetical protein
MGEYPRHRPEDIIGIEPEIFDRAAIDARAELTEKFLIEKFEHFIELGKEYTSLTSEQKQAAQAEVINYFTSSLHLATYNVDLDVTNVKPFVLNQTLTLFDDAKLKYQESADVNMREITDTFWESVEFLLNRCESQLVLRRADSLLQRQEESVLYKYLHKHIAELRPEWVETLKKYSQHAIFTHKGYTRFLDEMLLEDPDYLNNLTDDELLEIHLEVGDHDEVLSKYAELAAHETLATHFHDSSVALPAGSSNLSIVTRISPNEYGTFDQFGRLEKVFIPGEAAVQLQEALINANIYNRAGDEERVHDASLNLSSIMDLRFRQQLEDDYGISLADLSLREQLWLINALADSNREQDFAQTDFIQSYGLTGAKAFLSCEQDPKLREVILTLEDAIGREKAQQVFTQYAEISTFAQQSADDICKRFYADPEGRSLNAPKIQAVLLKQAKDILSSSHAASNQDELSKLLEKSKADTVIFLSIFEEAFATDKNFDLEDAKGCTFEKVLAKDIDADTKQAMLAMFDENWSDQDQIAAKCFKAKLSEKLDPANTETDFYILKKGTELTAMLRLDKHEHDGQLDYYFGSFNISPTMRGKTIGKAFMRRTIDIAAENHVIRAHVGARCQGLGPLR